MRTVYQKKLTKSSTNRVLTGVLGGIAEYLGIDATIIRLIFILLVWSGVSIMIYILLAIIMPEESKESRKNKKNRQEQEKWSSGRDFFYSDNNKAKKSKKTDVDFEEDDEDWSDY
ncbi:PspC domain-containing protein [Granulicatella seriolae]|uniref:PspC domain-containing protein n=1 Tax=Granulicatella seriolae TaxID=2967226 RepID=A0ABT1WMF1_9LACT|nr:PspC domain-containing protein [Granulicatella seriolae]